MKIIVLIKQVPDMEKVKFDSERGVVDRKSAGTEINPFDLNALEAAVQLKEAIGSTVLAVTMGPPNAENALREAISRGADEGILISDRKSGGSDTKATSAVLAAAINKVKDFDLIIAGEKTVDGDTGQVGAETAEYLAIPHVAYISKINNTQEGYIDVVSEICGGNYLKRLFFPGLMTVTKDINVPRLPSFKDKMRARKAEIKVMDFEALQDQLTADEVGIKGSPTKVKRVVVPPEEKREGYVYRENISEGIQKIIEILEEKKVLEG